MSFDENENKGPEVVNPQEGQFVEVEPVQAVPPVSNVPSSTPDFGEPVSSGEVPHFDSPVSNGTPKKDNKKIWIIVAIVLVVLCCCCLVIVLGGASVMDSPEFQDLMDEFSFFMQSLPTFASAWLAA